MKPSTTLTSKDWLAATTLGAALGMLILGAGSRLAMRGSALLSSQPAGFSVGGTITVVFLGTVTGLAAAILFLGLRIFVRNHRFIRGALFWVIAVLVTLRGLRPLDEQRIALFMPLVVVYGVALQVLWCRVYWRRSHKPTPLTNTKRAA